jgi:hypothetical protein
MMISKEYQAMAVPVLDNDACKHSNNHKSGQSLSFKQLVYRDFVDCIKKC